MAEQSMSQPYSNLQPACKLQDRGRSRVLCRYFQNCKDSLWLNTDIRRDPFTDLPRNIRNQIYEQWPCLPKRTTTASASRSYTILNIYCDFIVTVT